MGSNRSVEELEKRVALLEARVADLERVGTGALQSQGGVDLATLEVDGKTLDSEDGENARFSWRLVLESKEEADVRVDVVIQFVDMNSFAVLEHREYGLLLHPEKRQKFTGIRLLPLEIEEQVMGLKAAVYLA